MQRSCAGLMVEANGSCGGSAMGDKKAAAAKAFLPEAMRSQHVLGMNFITITMFASESTEKPAVASAALSVLLCLPSAAILQPSSLQVIASRPPGATAVLAANNSRCSQRCRFGWASSRLGPSRPRVCHSHPPVVEISHMTLLTFPSLLACRRLS